MASDRVYIHCTRNGSNVGGLVAVCSTMAKLSFSGVRSRFRNGNCNSFGGTMNRTIITRLTPIRRGFGECVGSATCLGRYRGVNTRHTNHLTSEALRGTVGGIKFVLWFTTGYNGVLFISCVLLGRRRTHTTYPSFLYTRVRGCTSGLPFVWFSWGDEWVLLLFMVSHDVGGIVWLAEICKWARGRRLS